MRPPLLACLTIALLAVACARQPRPTPPDTGADVQASDASATCRRWAEAKAERWLRITGRGAALDPAAPGRSDVIGNLDRFDAARERDRLYRACMQGPQSRAKGR